ncbi:MAG: acyl-CoA dehydrogenase/oxidase, partial [Olpidium bornovanus]
RGVPLEEVSGVGGGEGGPETLRKVLADFVEVERGARRLDERPANGGSVLAGPPEQTTRGVANECIVAEELFEKQLGKGDQRPDTTAASRAESQPRKASAVLPRSPFGHLKKRAQRLGLWNLFLPKEYPQGAGLTNLEYAPLCEIMGRSLVLAPEVREFAPCFGDVSPNGDPAWVKNRRGPPKQRPAGNASLTLGNQALASSDATNIETRIERHGDQYVINGRKWWISGAGDPRCKLFVVAGKSEPDGKSAHARHSVVLVPAGTPGITVVRPLTVFGYDDAPFGHCEVLFKDVKVPAGNVVLGDGRGFEVMQGRLGPATSRRVSPRIHHCMRAVGVAERALDAMLVRVSRRRAFGKLLAEQGTILADIARSRVEIDQARHLVLSAAAAIDRYGAKRSMKQIAMAKAIVPSMVLRVIDRSIQAHGAAGVGPDLPLAGLHAAVRTLRIADGEGVRGETRNAERPSAASAGPDEVHLMQIAKLEIRRTEELDRKERNRKALAAKL